MEIFTEAFAGMFTAVMKIFIIIIAGGVLIRKNIIKQEYIKGLSEVTVKILLPSLIFSKITTTFDPVNTTDWWLLPILGIATPIIFLGVIALFYLRKIKENISKFPLASFQNAGYLVLPIGQILYPNQYDKFALFVFLYVLGFNFVLWSVAKILITNTGEIEKFNYKSLITPPLIANIVSLLLVFLKLNVFIPEIIAEPIDMLGTATVPVAMLILGATLGSISFKKIPKISDLLKITLVKFVIFPTIVIFILLQTSIPHSNPLLADFLVIESSAAPAANLIVMVRKYGGNAQQTGSIMFVMYFLAIFVMPLTIAVWKILSA